MIWLLQKKILMKKYLKNPGEFKMEQIINTEEVILSDGTVSLRGSIYTNDYSKSWIIFAHGSGSSHKSVRNISVAKELTKAGHSTFLFDLLTQEEDNVFENRFNINLLCSRLLMATRWLVASRHFTHGTPVGYFGASTGAAAALMATAKLSEDNLIYAVISRGGRPDLVEEKVLKTIFTPTLLIVGGEDRDVIEMNKVAAQYLLNCRISIVPRATHLFPEPGALDEVIKLAIDWFDNHVPNILEHTH